MSEYVVKFKSKLTGVVGQSEPMSRDLAIQVASVANTELPTHEHWAEKVPTPKRKYSTIGEDGLRIDP